MQTRVILSVAVPSPLYRVFDYLLPPGYATPPLGVRVLVPFGSRELVGLVLSVQAHTDVPADKLKSVLSVIDEAPVFGSVLLQLCQWIAEYYAFPVGEVIATMMPKYVRQGKALVAGPCEPAVLTISENTDFVPTASQKKAIEAIKQARNFQVFLLWGVTGSGKTAVYINAMKAVVARGEQVLVLVPEIGLTPQTLSRFEAHFSHLTVLHSGLTDKKRFTHWCQAVSGKADVIIGTRSAIFVPLPKLGLIVIDESHDLSFKQQSSVRYHARDVGVMRAKYSDVPIVLGTATPSMESYHNVLNNKYTVLRLAERATGAKLPTISLINVCDQPLVEGLSPMLLNSMRQHLDAGGQVLLFLNRRGFSPVLMCHHCGWIKKCTRCDANMVLHGMGSRATLRCHHCEAARPIPSHCGDCGESELLPIGLGTEKLAAVIEAEFPSACVVRVDRDTTRKKGTLASQLAKAHNEADILIGTQMLAKGHHFPKLTLVALIEVDGGLYSADFRATEQLAQLLVQVAGRAGRENVPGEVLVQTHHASHPLLQQLLRADYDAVLDALYQERCMAQLPPAGGMLIIRAESVKAKGALDFLTQVKAYYAPRFEQVNFIGPLPQPIEKKAGRYRAQLILQCEKRQLLSDVGLTMAKGIAASKRSRHVRWVIDIDPVLLFS